MKFVRVALAAIAILAAACSPAPAQQVPLQAGPWVAGHAPMYSGSGGAQPIIQDSGTAGGGAAGANIGEMGITARGTGTPPYDAQGHGPNGEIFCAYDAPTTNATGYHYLCMSPNIGGEGLISYGAGGGAAAQSLTIDVNGVPFPLVSPLPIANGGTGQTTANAALNALLPTQAGQNGKVLLTNGTSTAWTAVAGVGTVTSVALALPAEFSISGSPVTAAGTLTGAWATQTANRVFAGPASGGAATPAFRALVGADIPNFSTTVQGGVPASGATGSTVNFIRGDGTWTSPGNSIWIEQYGGGTGVANNATAFGLAVAALPSGGIIEFKCGTYAFGNGVAITDFISLKGCGGGGQTTLNFNTTVASIPGITLNGVYNSNITDILIANANGPGIEIKGLSQGAAHNSAFLRFDGLKISGSKIGSCFRMGDVYLSTFSNISIDTCNTYGVQQQGFTTSLTFTNVSSVNATNSGYYLNDMTYSSFVSTAADNNGDYGYEIANLNGVSFQAVGGENNEKGLFVASASNAIAAGKTAPDIKGVTITSAASVNNGWSAAFYSSFLEATSANSRTLDITVIGGVEISNPNGISFILNGTGTAISQISGNYLGTRTGATGALLRVWPLVVVAVASLPTCSAVTAGQRAGVNNATATTFASIVAGGGANAVPVYCNGTNWIIG